MDVLITPSQCMGFSMEQDKNYHVNLYAQRFNQRGSFTQIPMELVEFKDLHTKEFRHGRNLHEKSMINKVFNELERKEAVENMFVPCQCNSSYLVSLTNAHRQT